MDRLFVGLTDVMCT